MKSFAVRTIVGAAALTLVAAGALVVNADDVTPVQNETFSITLPAGFGAFAAQTQKTKAADGEIETTNYISKAPTGEAVVVTVSRMPGKITDPQKLMDSTRDSLLTSLKATLESEQKIEGEVPGVTLLFKGTAAENAPYLRSQLEVRGDTFYQVLYVGRSEDQRNVPAVGELFQSFRLAPAAAATAPADAPAAPAAAPAPAAADTTASN